MDALITFFQNYGLALLIIAVIGIIILGIMKYCNLFKKIDENKRHYIYLLISISFSIIASIIYLLIVKKFEINYVIAVSVAIYGLNQTFYNIFKVTPVNDLFVKILDWIKEFIKRRNENQ